MRVLARRYAAALADVALERRIPDQVKTQLAGFVGLMKESADLRNFLESPAIPLQGKQAVIEKLVARLGASETLRNFLFVLAEHRRSAWVEEIEQAFAEELNARLGIAEARVTSARELKSKEKAELTRALERVTGKRIEARYELDPELIGGAVVRIGSTVYDGSVRDQLNRLRVRLASA